MVAGEPIAPAPPEIVRHARDAALLPTDQNSSHLEWLIRNCFRPCLPSKLSRQLKCRYTDMSTLKKHLM